MRMSLLCSVTSVFLVTGAAFAQSEGEFPATLKGHGVKFSQEPEFQPWGSWMAVITDQDGNGFVLVGPE